MRWTVALAMMTAGAVSAGMGAMVVAQVGQTSSGASTRPSGAMSVNTSAAAMPTTRLTPADQLLNQMLKPAEAARRPLLPEVKSSLKDATSGKGAVAPEAPEMPLLREGTFIVDRTGRLVKSSKTPGTYEFAFDTDGRVLKDPPLVLLPNSRLEAMENQITAWDKPVRFQVTGVVTTYKGRNGLLVERATVLPDAVQMDPP